jgi:GNAT superfamily N-acetyltransferase
VSTDVNTLPGQETLVACWRALAQTSGGARLVHSSAAIAAVFPAWEPLNNAIMLAPHASAAAAAAELADVYSDAGVDKWALWVPSPAVSLDASDDVRTVGGLERDTTTLVMRVTLSNDLRRDDRVVAASIAAVARLGDEPIPVSDLGEPESAPGLAGWAMVDHDVAVSCGWSFVHGSDCGIYAVETLASRRRRGFARSLVEHMLADAGRRGARTATLQSTRIGQHLYGSLGFEPAGRYEEWTSR